jgi:hypothetical protein
MARDTGNVLEPMDLSAPEFVLSQLAWVRDLAIEVNSNGRDFSGALDAGQYGMAYVIAHQGLRRLIGIYLRSNFRVITTPDPARLYELLAEFSGGTDSDVYRHAWDLETRNPQTGDEVIAYVERWKWYVGEVLGLKQSPIYSLDYDDAMFANYYQRSYEVALAGEPLGLTGVPSPQQFERAFVGLRCSDGID